MPLRMIFTIIFKSNHVDACARFISYRGPIGLGSAAPDTGWPPLQPRRMRPAAL